MKINRLVSIIMILLDKKRISAQELADMFEVSLRTIYRDIDAINMSGIPIHSTPGVGGGFEIMQNYKLDKTTFSTTDLSAILMGVSNFSSTMPDKSLLNTIAKVKSFIPPERIQEIDIKTNQIHIDLHPWMGNKNIQSYLEVIKAALQEKQLISFDYADRHGNKTSRIVELYQLVLKGNQWYCQCYCLEKTDFRLFKLARISKLELEKEIFVPRNYQKPLLDMADILETLQIKIKIRIHKSIMDSVLDYCTYEEFEPDGKEHYIVDFPFIENDYYYNILLGFGNQCECLEPASIRKGVKSKIDEMARLYK